MPVSNAANPRDNIVRLPGNHTLPTFQCKKGFGQLINKINNTDLNPQWLQSLRERRAIRLETKYERYTTVLDENDNLTVTAEKISLSYSIQTIWYSFTHSAIFRGLFGHSAPDIRAADIKTQIEKKYYHALWDKYLLWEEWRNNAPPKEKTLRDKAMMILQNYLKTQSTFLKLDYLSLSSLPDELPPGLIWLDVSFNKLRALPPLPASLKKLYAYRNELSELPPLPDSLEKLVVEDNQLQELPPLPDSLQSLGASNNQLRVLPVLPASLKTLSVANNQLRELPPLPDSLEKLVVKNNQLQELPELPASLQVIDASRNPLRTLPESITRLPRNAEVTITAASLSPQTLQTLQNLRTNPNYQGPRINFDMAGSLAKIPVQPLSDAVIAWFPVGDKDSVAAQWASVNQEENAPAFSAFLDRLNDTVSAKKVSGFKEQVTAWLTKLQESPALRALTFAISYDATETCEDRVALAYNSMQQAMLTHDIENGKYDKDLPGLFSVARELFRLEKLEEIAREKVKSLHFVDEIEVYLAFQVKLRHALALTSVTEEMRFFGVSHVTADDLAIAEIQIKSAENSEFSGWLSQWAPWHCLLKRIEPGLYEAADTKKYDVTERITSRIDAELKTLGLQNDARAAADSGKEITAAIREIDRKLTTEVLLNRKLASLLSWQWEIDAPHKAVSPGG